MHGPAPHLIGEIFADALPTEDPVLYGHADIEPKGAFEARSLQTFTLVYTAGRYGLDDTGAIKIVFRFTADGGDLQTREPTAPNYVTAVSSTGIPLRVAFDANGFARPWYQALTVSVHKGFLREGDRITITLGDRSGGSPGLILQSMCESAFTWRVLADVCATGHFVPIAASPAIRIVPGPPALWKAILPTLRRPGEVFRLGLKAEDRFGNPSDQIDTIVFLSADGPVRGLPDSVRFAPGARAVVIDGLSVLVEGRYCITARDPAGTELAVSNPIEIAAGPIAAWWGDMHGQSGESVGLNTAREYFTFARDLAFLDATSHQANDFQVNGAFWSHINALTAEFHEDHRFLTVPGYEWSGNTGVGGDRNVYFRTEGRTIRRSSHALIRDRREITTDAPTARALFEALQAEDCVVYAHIGGRPADVAYAHDPRLETAMEIHSAWGTFEWLMADCFRAGYRVGVVANSDGHKGRPGASYPGTSEFGAYGGLTCFLMDALTRDAWFECLRKRRHYATTGARIHADVTVTASDDFKVFDRDPALDGNEQGQGGQGQPAKTLQMGDIAWTAASHVRFCGRVSGASPIERIDVLNAMETVATIRNPATVEGTARYRIVWRGAMVKGRGARASWHGRAQILGGRILRTSEINAWNPDRRLTREGDDTVRWDSVTAGNFGAIDLWLDRAEGAILVLETNHASARIPLEEVGRDDRVIPAGGLDLEIRVFRLPEALAHGPLSAEVSVPLHAGRDNPIWMRATTEDGFQLWSSPIYVLSGPRQP